MKFKDIQNYSYKPLPDILTLKVSDIHGIGLFSKSNIKANVNLGQSHEIKIDKNPFKINEVVRRPLGGFINHSENPNCRILDEGDMLKYTEGKEIVFAFYCNYFLVTLRSIGAGEELTVDYTQHKFCNDLCEK